MRPGSIMRIKLMNIVSAHNERWLKELFKLAKQSRKENKPVHSGSLRLYGQSFTIELIPNG